MNRSTTQKSARRGAIAIAFLAIASLVATVAAAQNVPPGCTPTSDGGYTCPGPGRSGENYDNGNGLNPAGAGAESGTDNGAGNENRGAADYGNGTDNPNAADNGTAYDNGGGADNGADNGVNAEGEPPVGAGNEAGSGYGQGLNPPGLSSDLSGNLSGNGEMTAGTSSDLGNTATAGAALGMTTEQLAKLKARLSMGPLSADELQQLCVQLASRHLSAGDAETIARTLDLNLSAEQLTQLESCAQLTGNGAPATSTRRAQTRPGTRRGVQTANRAAQQNLSTIEKSFRGLDRDLPPQVPSPDRLTQYGYSLFRLPVSTFAPVNNVPVSGDYLIGPGDELKILMWGRINRTFDLQVDRAGAIAIPEVGPLQVAGLSFAQARKLVEERAGQITGVQVDLTMGRLRTIQVFVIGEVNHPGPYTVSSLSHVSNVLVACGGITKIGSLRKVQLRRGNQMVREFDLYDTLMRGDTGADEQVEANDVIFVPVIGPVVAIAGDVKRPAIYELRSSPADLPDTLKLAGGISPFGYSRRIQVERVENHENRIVLDTDLKEVRSQRFPVEDGDLIKVFPVLPQQDDIVTVKGNVFRPGKYEWHHGMRVADLIREAEGVAPRTFMRYAMIRRQHDPNRVIHIVPVDLSGALSDHLSGPANIPLDSRDELTVFKLDQIRDLPTVQVFGEVRNPGFYMTSPDMRVSDLIYLAGGLKDDAYLAKAEVARTQVVNGTSTRHSYIDIDLAAALKGSDEHNTALENNDQLFIWRASNWHLPWVAQVNGQVLRPGPYTFHEGERLAAILERCGGMLPDAYPRATVFIRRSVKQLEQTSIDESRARLHRQIAQVQLMPKQAGQSEESRSAQALAYLGQVLEESQGQQASGRMVVHLQPLDELVGTKDNVLLEDQDQITIPRRPSAVSVLGQVYHPTAVVFDPNLTARDYLDRAGGPAEGSDEDHIFVFKADGEILTDDGVRNSNKSKLFPLLPVMSGGLLSVHLEPGDTVYVPEKLIFTSDLEYAKDVSTIIAAAVQSIAVVGILATNL
jgi:protein involved in polysaccharide export with SLBB domain